MNPEEITSVLTRIVPTMRSTGFTIQTATGSLVVVSGRDADQLADLLEHQQKLALIYAQHTAQLADCAPEPAAAAPLAEAVAIAQPSASSEQSSDPAATEANLLTTQERRQQFADSGESVKAWAESNGFGDDLTAVYRVLNDQSPARRGKHHEIAVKLGLKPAPTCAKQQADCAPAPATTRKPLTDREVGEVLNDVFGGVRS